MAAQLIIFTHENECVRYDVPINIKNAMNNQINGISLNNANIGVYMETARGAMRYVWN